MSERSKSEAGNGADREHDVLERLAFANLREQRRARRWGIFFKLFFVVYLVLILVLFRLDSVAPSLGDHTALVELEGVIAANGDIDADRVVKGLRKAFEGDGVKGVILRVNSPGGSPVQASYINGEITRLREKHPDISLVAVISDICASGGYYAAVAAEKIYADKSSIVGSIGVLMDSFGFVDTMEKIGVERRLLTAGEHKAMLDPFSPLDPVDVRHTEGVLKQVHNHFIDVVRSGRGERLAANEDIFSGLFWTGEEARKLGLIDEFGSAGFVAREIFGAEKIVDYTPSASLLEQFAQHLGIGMSKTLGAETLHSFFRIR
jgi:protease-4